MQQGRIVVGRDLEGELPLEVVRHAARFFPPGGEAYLFKWGKTRRRIVAWSKALL